MFTDDKLPITGHLKMESVEPMVLLQVIRRFEERGAMERADQARRECGEIFRYANVTGRAEYHLAPDLVDALREYRKENYPFLPINRSREFHKVLEG